MPPRKSKRKSTKRTSSRRPKSPHPSFSSASSTSLGSFRSSLPIGPAFKKLVGVMARLRSPNGCPWDREQTHSTLRTYLIEEAYEVLDALDSTDDAKFAEELGDLLLQVLFHAQIASEEGRFNISDVVREIYEKMIRRHPHVFGTKRAKTAAEVLHNWEIIKQQERQAKRKKPQDEKDRKDAKETAGTPSSILEGGSLPSSPSSTSSMSLASFPSLLDGVPRTLPALLEALQLTRKAARIGFDWPDVEGIFAKLTEETHELQCALASSSPAAADAGAPPSVLEGGSFLSPSPTPASLTTEPAGRGAKREGESIESELGDLLFAAVNLARFLNIDPEIALKQSSSKFSRRFRTMERLAREQGTTLAKIPRHQMESFWDQSKLQEQDPPTK